MDASGRFSRSVCDMVIGSIPAKWNRAKIIHSVKTAPTKFGQSQACADAVEGSPLPIRRCRNSSTSTLGSRSSRRRARKCASHRVASCRIGTRPQSSPRGDGRMITISERFAQISSIFRAIAQVSRLWSMVVIAGLKCAVGGMLLYPTRE